MKIFLTGASGLVGAACARVAARAGHEVVGVVGRFQGEIHGLSQRLALELTDEAAVTTAVLDARPQAILNCAAISEPAACEQDPTGSAVINVALPATLARLAKRSGAALVHISSEQVFDGERTTGYAIGDATAPINVYGRQKVASERAVLEAAPGLVAVVRAPLLMGDSPGGKRSLHERLLADWAAGRTARLYVDEFRQPCTAANLAEALLEIVERSELSGIFHWAGGELISRYELGRRVREHFELSEAVAPIVGIARGETPEATRQRQACLALDIAPLADALKARPQSIAEQLASLRVPELVRAWLEAKRGRAM